MLYYRVRFTGRYGRETEGHAAKDHRMVLNPGCCNQDLVLMVRALPGEPPLLPPLE